MRKKAATRPRMPAWAAPALVAATALVAYVTTLGHALVWDDLELVSTVERVLREGGLAGLLRSDFILAEPTGYYRPLVLLTLWLDSLAAGGLPWPFHLTNVLLHACASTLVWALVRAVAGPRAGLAGGLLFAVHPVHVESVAFVSGRTDVLAAVFCVGGAWLWARGRAGRATRPVGEAAAAGAALFLAALSKEVAFALPVVLLAGDAGLPVPAGAGRWWPRNRRWVLAWAVALGAALVLRSAWAGVGWGRPPAPDVARPGIPGLWLTYLRLLVFPWPLRPFYTAAQAAVTVGGLAAAAALAGMVAAAGGRARGGGGLLGLAWTLGFLAPVGGVVALSAAPVAERFLYLPSVGFCFAAACAWDRAAAVPRLRTAAWATLAAACAVLLALTMEASRTWKDPLTLFSRMAAASPEADIAFHNLGMAYHDLGRPDEAIAALEQALRLDPDYVEALNDLGIVLASAGRYREAEDAYRRALGLDPSYADAHYNLGNALLAGGHSGRAAVAFRQASQLEPGISAFHNNLGMALAAGGSLGEAGEAFARAVALDPANAAARFNLGLARLLLGDREGARDQVRELEVLDPPRATELSRRLAAPRGN